MGEQEQEAKLARLVEVARSVWKDRSEYTWAVCADLFAASGRHLGASVAMEEICKCMLRAQI